VRRARALVVVLLGAAAPAWAHGGAIDAAVDALATAPVYVEPGAEPALTQAQAQRLADRIQTSGRTIYVAVIDEQDDPAHEVVHELVSGVGRDGTYVVVAGGDFGVHGTDVDHEVSERLQADANAKPKNELAGTLNTLVDDVQREAAPAAEDDDSAPWVWIAVALVAIAAVAAAATFWALRRGRGHEAQLS
jgi:hypothetical protein